MTPFIFMQVKLPVDSDIEMQYCFVIELDKHSADHSSEALPSESCYEAMKACLDQFVASDVKILKHLNSHCR